MVIGKYISIITLNVNGGQTRTAGFDAKKDLMAN